ncbi:LysR family transcriptional regulator [Hahella aquimaris]|uniref:LysR family transcriptional regulator n=1 Tax=Hahella sp. HNIBRBA332 TaxID=3015983 RepID=UPI00273BF7A5|nr:LysR family transcriptional regulator [Hahella sp. HNIBRBA332]WLQ13574.1 LysR family transcriptional regulator [Hahella sp. HNIBRBA332]
MSSINDLTVFHQTALHGSLTAAARELDMTPAAASAAIKRLEQSLDTTLFVRSTRSLRLTSEGESYLHHCRAALNALDAGRRELLAKKGEIGGTLRLSASSDFGRNLLMPWLDEFQVQYPNLVLRLELTDRVADINRENVDIALRYGAPPDSNHVAFNIVNTRRIICGSPAYFERYGDPLTPQDLRNHNCLLYLVDERAYDQWGFHDGDQRITVNVNGDRISNDAEAVHRWAVAGVGLANKSMLDMSDDLLHGRVRATLSQYACAEISMYLVCPGKKQVTPAALLLRDFLREKCAAALAAVE